MGYFRPLSQTKFINDANLIAYYKLEDTSDSKGTNTLTNLNTVAFNPAKFANGADLGASNTDKNLEVTSNLGITGSAVTISMWVKMQAEIASGNWYLAELTTGASNYRGFYINYQYNSGTRRFSFAMFKEGVESFFVNSNITAGTTDYYNLVLTYDGTNINGYINGSYVGQIAASGTGSSSYNLTNFVLGCYKDASNGTRAGFASAIIDDTSVFSRALSAGEVAELYQSQTFGEYLPNTNSVLFTDNFSGTPDNWTNFNSGTHSFSGNEMSVVDNSGSASRGVALTNALPSLTATSRIKTRLKVTGVGGSGDYIGLVQMIDNTTDFNGWFGLYYHVTTGKFANNAGTDLNTSFSVDTYYDIDIVIHKNTGTWDVYINGTLDTAGIAAISGWTDARLARPVIGGGNSPRTWTIVTSSFTYYVGTSLLLHLNGNSTDSSGNANNGTDTAITYSLANGKFGQGAGFNGSTSKIVLPNSADFKQTGDFTVNLWFKGATTSNVLFSSCDLFSAYVKGLVLYISANKLRGITGNGVTQTVLTGGTTVTDNTWRMGTLVKTGTTLKLYVNGSSDVADATSIVEPTYNSTNYPRLGIATDTGTDYYPFNGNLDEVIFEARAWSASQIKKYYTYTKGRFGI